METTEKIVEAYCRYVKGWFTLPNIRCKGQLEIDLLALDVDLSAQVSRYHVETGVSISGGFSKLTAKPFSINRLRRRVEQAGQRRTIDFFMQRKFEPPEVLSTLCQFGFLPGNYERVIVTWGWTEEAAERANEEGIRLWDFRVILKDIADVAGSKKSYFTDDTLRTLQLFSKALGNPP